MYSCPHATLSLSPDSPAFRPATGHINSRQSIEIEAFGTIAAMSYEVSFQKARASILPIGKGTDGDRTLKQTPGLSSTEGTTPSYLTTRAQYSIDRRWASLAELRLNLGRQDIIL